MDKIDQAAAAASAQPLAPKAMRFDIGLPGNRQAIVVMPTPITPIELFHISAFLARWWQDQFEKEHPASGIELPPAGMKLPPPPNGLNGH